MTQLSNEFLDLQAALAGEYSLERELGRGGMAVVYLARDVQLDRHVAIKVLPGHLASAAESRERFLREARTAAGLSHPHIVPIHRVSEAAGFVFYVMSYVPGETLGERLRRAGPLPPSEAMRLMREVSWALAYAHQHGIVHRDVKPDNILLEEGSGRALVTDFGIAHVGDSTLSTDPGRLMGTAQFMSPEQVTSEVVDGRSDLYSLGAVGFLAVSGTLPFDGANLPALLLKQVTEPARNIASVAPGVPRALAAVIDRCLSKDPSDRFDNGEQLAAALAPETDGRPQLPPALRAWLAERNPAMVVYAGWSGLMAIPILSSLAGALAYANPQYLAELRFTAALALAPLVPIVGFHVNQARRLFKAGFTLADLRGALDVAAMERGDAQLGQLGRGSGGPVYTRGLLRWSTYGALLSAFVLTFLSNVIRVPLEQRHIVMSLDAFRGAAITAWVAAGVLLCAVNMNQIPFLPAAVRQLARGGIRERLWRSRLGTALANWLGAPETSRAVSVGVFQATELALGLAAADLFKALPSEFRDQLAELPAIVSALETRAAAARADLQTLAPVGHAGLAEHERSPQVANAQKQLAKSVAALERIRLDLLRLRAGASDLAPLTTLLDAARELSEQVGRLSEAQREVEAQLPVRRGSSRRVPTPV